jgi:predicted nucleic acid-binding protein
MIVVCDASPVIALALCGQLELLDKRESEAIVLALEKTADYLLVDEKKGRKTAEENGLKVIGSLGVLIMAKRKTLIKSIKPSLDILLNSSTRISDYLYEQALKMTDETTP